MHLIQQFDSMHQWYEKQRLNRTLRHLHLQLKLIKEKIKWISTFMKFTFRQLFNWLKNNGTYLFPFHNKHTYFLSLKILLEKKLWWPKMIQRMAGEKKRENHLCKTLDLWGAFHIVCRTFNWGSRCINNDLFQQKKGKQYSTSQATRNIFFRRSLETGKITRRWVCENWVSVNLVVSMH